MSLNSAIDDDVVLHIASFADPEDLPRLALTCRRLGSKRGTSTERGWRKMARDAKRRRVPLRDRSLMDEAARRIIEATSTEEERACLPPGAGWMGKYNELRFLREPLIFDRLFGDAFYEKDDKSVIRSDGNGGSGISCHCMGSGRHYASFTGNRNSNKLNVGLAGRRVGSPNLVMLLYRFDDGHLCWTESETENISILDWQGMEGANDDDVIGMLLDFDEGSLTVYKNGRKLGVIAKNITGFYYWTAHFLSSDGRAHGASVKMRRGAIPA